jgi:hypothetical protein
VEQRLEEALVKKPSGRLELNHRIGEKLITNYIV